MLIQEMQATWMRPDRCDPWSTRLRPSSSLMMEVVLLSSRGLAACSFAAGVNHTDALQRLSLKKSVRVPRHPRQSSLLNILQGNDILTHLKAPPSQMPNDQTLINPTPENSSRRSPGQQRSISGVSCRRRSGSVIRNCKTDGSGVGLAVKIASIICASRI